MGMKICLRLKRKDYPISYDIGLHFYARDSAGEQVGSGQTSTVLVVDVFGLTTFVVLAENQILALVHTEAGVFIRAVIQRMSQYRALPLKLKLYPVRMRS